MACGGVTMKGNCVRVERITERMNVALSLLAGSAESGRNRPVGKDEIG